MGIMRLQRLDELLETDFQVHTAHEGIVVMPIAALFSRQGLEGHAIHRFVTQVGTSQGIVNAQ